MTMKKLLFLGGIALCFSAPAFAGCEQLKGAFSFVTYQGKARTSKPVRLTCEGETVYYTSVCSNAHFHSERAVAVCLVIGRTTTAEWLVAKQSAQNMDTHKSVKDERLLGKHCAYADSGWQCQSWQPVKNIKVQHDRKQMTDDEDSGAYAIIDR